MDAIEAVPAREARETVRNVAGEFLAVLRLTSKLIFGLDMVMCVTLALTACIFRATNRLPCVPSSNVHPSSLSLR
jgi:hypothetical protein